MRQDNNPVLIHTDLRTRAVDWCKEKLEKHEWDHKTFTDVYEDTFFFEHKEHSQHFAHEFIQWVNQKG